MRPIKPDVINTLAFFTAHGGSGVERTLGFQPNCVRFPTSAGAGGKARMFVYAMPSRLIGMMQFSNDFDSRFRQSIQFLKWLLSPPTFVRVANRTLHLANEFFNLWAAFNERCGMRVEHFFRFEASVSGFQLARVLQKCMGILEFSDLIGAN